MNQRDFTFRAWDSNKKEWCYGYEILGGFNLKGEVILMGEFGKYPLEYLFEHIIVMQQSPFVDKDLKPVFEGDILKDGKDLYVISFGEANLGPDDWGVQRIIYGWRIEFMDEKGSYGTLSQNGPGYGVYTSDCIIAGNIFQHKHLIEN